MKRFRWKALFGGLVTGGEPNTALYGRTVKKKLDPKIDAADRSHKKDFSKKWMEEVGKADVKAKPAKESKKLFGKKDAGSEDVI